MFLLLILVMSVLYHVQLAYLLSVRHAGGYFWGEKSPADTYRHLGEIPAKTCPIKSAVRKLLASKFPLSD